MRRASIEHVPFLLVHRFCGFRTNTSSSRGILSMPEVLAASSPKRHEGRHVMPCRFQQILGFGERPRAFFQEPPPRLCRLFAWLCLAVPGLLHASSGNVDDLIQRYEDLLLLQSGDYESVDVAKAVLQGTLSAKFRRAARHVESFSFARRGEPAYFVNKLDTEIDQTAEQPVQGESNSAFHSIVQRDPQTSRFRNI